MPSALSRSYSVPVGLVRQQVQNSSESNASSMTQQIDPKAVGAHRPLNRRRSNPPGSAESEENLFNADSLTTLSLLSNQLSQHPSMLMMQLQQQQQQQQQQHKGHRKLDRSQSEPVTDRMAVSTNNSNSSRYKTELCRPFEENGTCKYGDKCQFAHGFHELRSLIRHPKYKTELCRTFHTIGFCPYGPRCHFIHNADEARNHSPPPGVVLNNNNNNNNSSSSKSGLHQHHQQQIINNSRSKFNLSQQQHIGGGSTADSPSPPSSLSESPTSMSTFFSDDLFPGNPFSPATTSSGLHSASAFLFGSTDFVSPLLAGKAYSGFKRHPLTSSSSSSSTKFELDSPSPVESLASDLDSLSLGGSGGGSTGAGSPPPPTISSPMDTSRALRLPIFSRISETLNED